MRRVLNTIKELILLFLLLGFGTALFDFTRISAGEKPIFSSSTFHAKTKVESFKGLFYRASRTVHVDPSEKFMESSHISFHLLNYPLSVPSSFKTQKLEYSVDVNFSDICSMSTLYFADLNTKVYLYCIDSIDYLQKGEKESIPFVSALKNNSSLAEIFVADLSFKGLASDQTTLVFDSNGLLSSRKFSVYRCQQTHVNDIYIVPWNSPMQADFCTYKNDDDAFLWTVIEDDGLYEDSEYEVLYEDDKYYYEYPVERFQNTYILYPGVRGKPEREILLRDALNSHMYSFEELKSRGLTIHQRAKEEVQEDSVIVEEGD